MFNVYQPWDPLRVCIVGRGYGPDFYSWIKDVKLRNLFEQVAIEGEEDFQSIIKLLKKFNVEVLRPNLPMHPTQDGIYVKPPVLPRDNIGIIGDTLYENISFDFEKFYSNVKDPSWPVCESIDSFCHLPKYIQDECFNIHGMRHWQERNTCYNNIMSYVKNQSNVIKSHVRNDLDICNQAMVYPLGHDNFFGTWSFADRPAWKDIARAHVQQFVDQEFYHTKNHILDTQGHSDSTWCVATPGLIFSDQGDYNLEELFPGWEIIKFPGTLMSQTSHRRNLDHHDTNKNTWMYNFPNFEDQQSVKNLVEKDLQSWIGQSQQTVFEVGLVSIDEKNVITGSHNKILLDALKRHGVTAHYIDFRYQWFWDGGIHCVTSDLHREGTPGTWIGVSA
jgi:hypothetical protein